PRTAPACADYAERERLHCEAIIPNASPRQSPPPPASVLSSCTDLSPTTIPLPLFYIIPIIPLHCL
ncbi:MAG: hypothetical protein LBQ31_09280, partial [Bacteroidales bacterium]|nr:hypothetical protein [Bacteroidales bacterium]